jgi:hypothetical protein
MKMYNDDELNPVLYQEKNKLTSTLSNKIKHIAMRLSAMGRRHDGSCFKAFVNQYPEVKITVISVLFQTF